MVKIDNVDGSGILGVIVCFIVTSFLFVFLIGCGCVETRQDGYLEIAQDFAEQAIVGDLKRKSSTTEITNVIYTHSGGKPKRACGSRCPAEYCGTKGSYPGNLRDSDDEVFVYNFVRDSLSAQRNVAWVWFSDKNDTLDRQWVVRLICVDSKWLVDIPIVH